MDTTKFRGQKKLGRSCPRVHPSPMATDLVTCLFFFVLLRCFPITVSSGSCDLNEAPHQSAGYQYFVTLIGNERRLKMRGQNFYSLLAASSTRNPALLDHVQFSLASLLYVKTSSVLLRSCQKFARRRLFTRVEPRHCFLYN